MTGLLILSILVVVSATKLGGGHDHGHVQEPIFQPSPKYTGPARTGFGGAQPVAGQVFGGAQPVLGGSVFGGAQPVSGGSVFGGAQPVSGGSAFGGAQPVSGGSAFGGAQPVSGGSAFGGARPVSGGSAFGGAQPVSGGAQPVVGGAQLGLYGQPGPAISATGFGTVGEVGTRLYTVNGVMTFDNHACVFQNGEVQITGPHLGFGQSHPYEIGPGFAIIETGERVQVNDGLMHVSVISISNVQKIRSILDQTGMTYEEFVERTGTVPPQQGMFEVTAGVITINGIYRNINAGLMVVVQVVELGTVPQPVPIVGVLPKTGVQRPVGGGARTVPTRRTRVYPVNQQNVVTETAPRVTQTDTWEVLITKTRTGDIYITITSNVFNSFAVDATNFLKETVTVQEEQVIRSTLPGVVIVTTVPIQTQIVITVTDTATRFFVETALDTITHTLDHYVPIFNFATVTILNPRTTTVTSTIRQTTVTTTTASFIERRTRYQTSTVVVTVTGSSYY